MSNGALQSRNPAHPDRVVWSGAAELSLLHVAIDGARRALPAWAGAPRERRLAVLTTYKQLCEQRVDAIASLICDETGKALWDAKQEASILAAKVDITLDATPGSGPLSRVSGFETTLAPTRSGRCWFRPRKPLMAAS